MPNQPGHSCNYPAPSTIMTLVRPSVWWVPRSCTVVMEELMENPFFDRPIINSPYEYPSQHWKLDEEGQPTQQIIESRRGAEFVTPIPKPRQRGKGQGWTAAVCY